MSDNEFPNHVKKRLKYYDGQFLVVQDFQAEQNYHLDRQRRQNRLLRTPGILEGLEVEVNDNRTGVKIAPGTAVDYQGRLIIVSDLLIFQGKPESLGSDGKFEIDIGEYDEATAITLYLGYREVNAERDIPLDDEDQAREVESPPRWEEQAVLEVTDEVPNNKEAIQFGIININSDGSIRNVVRRDFETYSAIEFGTDSLGIRRRHGSRLEVTGSLSIQQHLSVSRNLNVSGDVSFGNSRNQEKLSVDGGIITKGRGLTFISSDDEVNLNIDPDQITSERNQLERQLSQQLISLEQSLESIENSLSETPVFVPQLGSAIFQDGTIGNSSINYMDGYMSDIRPSAISSFRNLNAIKFSEINFSDDALGTIRLALSETNTSISNLERMSEVLSLLLDERRNTEDFTTGIFTGGFGELDASNIEFLTPENINSFQEEVRNLESLLETTDGSLDAYQAIAKDIGAYGIGAREADSLVYDTHKYHRWRVNGLEKLLLSDEGLESLSSPNLDIQVARGPVHVNGGDGIPSSRSSRAFTTAITFRLMPPKHPTRVLVIAHAHSVVMNNGVNGDSAIYCPIFIDEKQYAADGSNPWGFGTGLTHSPSWVPMFSIAEFTTDSDRSEPHLIEWKAQARLWDGTSKGCHLRFPVMAVIKLGALN